MEILTADDNCFLLVSIKKNYSSTAFYSAEDLERGGEKEGKRINDGVVVHGKLSTDR